jgi:hypothetical protein
VLVTIVDPDVERRLARVEAKQEVEAVMAQYLYLVDCVRDADRIAELFTEHAIWELRGNLARGQEPSRGHQQIRALFAGVAQTIRFLAHYITNAHIEIADDLHTAHGRWHAIELLTLQDAQQMVLLAWYENDFVRVGDTWKIQHIRFEESLSFRLASADGS